MLPVKRFLKEQKEYLLLAVLGLLLLTLSYYNLVFLERVSPGMLLEKTLHSMTENYAYLEMDIQEKGAGYSLSFSGVMMEGKLIQGTINDYMLDVIYRPGKGELYARDIRDDLWKTACEMELDNLKDFFFNPIEMLKLHEGLARKARYGRTETDRVVVLALPLADIKGERYLGDSGEELLIAECLFFIAETEGEYFLNRLYYSVYGQSGEEKLFSRSFTFRKPPQGENAVPVFSF